MFAKDNLFNIFFGINSLISLNIFSLNIPKLLVSNKIMSCIFSGTNILIYFLFFDNTPRESRIPDKNSRLTAIEFFT